MKKAILTIAIAAFAFAANAQFVIGGNIGFNTNGGNQSYESILAAAGTTTTTVYDLPQNGFTNLTLMPKIGYNLNEKMQVGIQFGIDWNKSHDYTNYAAQYTANIDGFEGWTNTSTLGFILAPYFRYNIAEFKGFTFFCEAQLSFSMTGRPSIHEYHSAYTVGGINFSEYDTTFDGVTKNSNLAITVVPGLNYKFNDKFSADIYIDLLGIGFSHSTVNNFVDLSAAGITNTTETITTTNRFYCMANANAQSLNAHFNAFRVGFNYHF